MLCIWYQPQTVDTVQHNFGMIPFGDSLNDCDSSWFIISLLRSDNMRV